MDDLRQDNKYLITNLAAVETKFGPAVIGTLLDDQDNQLQVYFPKALKLSNEQIMSYNERAVKDLQFVY